MSTTSRTTRNTTRRDRHRKQLARGKPPCAIEPCLFPGQPIDYDAHHLDPRSFTVDHIVPLAKGGADTLDNSAPAHRACNRAKSDTYDTGNDAAWTTWRTW